MFMTRSIRTERAGILPWRAVVFATVLIGLAPVDFRSAAVAQCTGDCNGNGVVGIDELVTGVNISLGTADLDQCSNLDADGNQQVSIDELVRAVLAALGACGNVPVVSDFVTQVGVLDFGVVGNQRTGSPPQPSGGPTVGAPASAMVINGGSAQLTVSASAPFSTVYLSVQGSVVDGFFELTLPQAANAIVLRLTLAQDIPEEAFSWMIAVATPQGAVSAPAQTAVEVVEVGTGDVQVSVSWDTLADVDLHVVEPSGEEIFYGNPVSGTGGTLDLDSNADCSADGVDNENITWPVGQAPRGSYTVRVDYYSACQSDETHYVVTVQRSGSAPQTFSGTLTGPGDEGDLGAGVTVTEFTF